MLTPSRRSSLHLEDTVPTPHSRATTQKEPGSPFSFLEQSRLILDQLLPVDKSVRKKEMSSPLYFEVCLFALMFIYLYLFIWLHWVLVAARGISSCG